MNRAAASTYAMPPATNTSRGNHNLPFIAAVVTVAIVPAIAQMGGEQLQNCSRK